MFSLTPSVFLTPFSCNDTDLPKSQSELDGQGFHPRTTGPFHSLDKVSAEQITRQSYYSARYSKIQVTKKEKKFHFLEQKSSKFSSGSKSGKKYCEIVSYIS